MTQSYNLSQRANNLNTAGQLDATDGLVGAVPPANGGTGQSTYAVGDILYASGATALAKLPDVATGNVLISGGVAVAPSYGKVGLTTHVSGTLPIANGGTNSTATPTAGGVVYGNGTAYAITAAGTAGQVLISSGTGAPVWSSTLSLGTTVSSTSGTFFDFTGISSSVRRITIMLYGVSTNGGSNFQIQIGSGSFTVSGYVSTGNTYNGSSGTGGSSATSGFVIQNGSASNTISCQMTLTTLGSNLWISSHNGKISTSNTVTGAGDVVLGAALDRIRITTINGTDTFDAGSINILYE